MGVDRTAFAVPKKPNNEQINQSFLADEGHIEFFDWRSNGHDMMRLVARLYVQRGGVHTPGADPFDVLWLTGGVKLSEEDLNIIEGAITSPGFVVREHLSENDPEFIEIRDRTIQQDLDFVSKARERIRDGYDVYFRMA